MQFDELSNFYKNFTDSLVVYDPLDRAIPDEDNDEAIKRVDLIQKLNEMPAVLGFALNAPMSKERSALLEKMFENVVQNCNKIGQEYQDQAQELGLEFKLDFHQNEHVKKIMKVHKFFENFKLIQNADVMQSRFEY